MSFFGPFFPNINDADGDWKTTVDSSDDELSEDTIDDVVDGLFAKMKFVLPLSDNEQHICEFPFVTIDVREQQHRMNLRLDLRLNTSRRPRVDFHEDMNTIILKLSLFDTFDDEPRLVTEEERLVANSYGDIREHITVFVTRELFMPRDLTHIDMIKYVPQTPPPS